MRKHKKALGSVVSGLTSALDQKDLEKALTKGKLQGQSNIEIINKAAERFEKEQSEQLKKLTQALAQNQITQVNPANFTKVIAIQQSIQ